MRFLRLAAAAAAAALLCAGSVSAAQQSTHTLGDILSALQRGAEQVDFRTVEPAASQKLDSLTTLFRQADAGSVPVETLAELIVRKRASVGDVARWDPRATELLTQPWFRSAVVMLLRIANGSLQPELTRRLQPPAVNEILALTDKLGRLVRQLASIQSEEKLRRFEIKYGPDSPRLNLAEVGLNYLAQWVPVLGPSADGWPSRYELVTAYRTMELTATKAANGDLSARLVSAGQVGLRWYHWKQGWGTGGRIARLTRPQHASFGAFAMGPRDAPLERPWGKGRRTGVFIGWGDVHAAYLFGDGRRVVLGSGKQLIPYVF